MGVNERERRTAEAAMLLAQLGPEGQSAVLRRARTASCAAGTVLFRQDDPPDRLHLLLSGSVKVWKVTPSGAPVTVRMLGPGELAGCVAAFCGVPFPATATVVQPARLMVWSAATLTELLAANPQLRVNALRLVGVRAAEMLSRIECLSTEPAEMRIARALLQLVKADGECQVASVSRQDLAELTATTLHTVSRVVSSWEREGWVKGGRGRITVLERLALQSRLAFPEKSSGCLTKRKERLRASG